MLSEVAAVRIESDQSPTLVGAAKQPMSIEVDRVGVIGVHVLQDADLGFGERSGCIAIGEDSFGFQPERAWPKPPTQ